MKLLTFRAAYVGPILAGDKRSTIRRPRAGLPVPGETVQLRCRYDRPPFALALVTSARDVTADQLTEADARVDGFASLAELLEALEDHGSAPAGLFAPTWRILTFDLQP